MRNALLENLMYDEVFDDELDDDFDEADSGLVLIGRGLFVDAGGAVMFPDELRVDDEILLRAPVEADAEVLAPALADPELGGLAGQTDRLPPEFDAPALAAMKAAGTFALYVVEDTSTGAVLGTANLAPMPGFGFVGFGVEIGGWVFPQYRRRGVATRCGHALIRYLQAQRVAVVHAAASACPIKVPVR
jgi:RimJ/RimL family protein N-acetyltransferase